ncbi:MAG TPA: serpin family protein [Thermoanaerobacterales bacterium]|nr:serpin family protein [Thermoanaerobacterales bacterium]
MRYKLLNKSWAIVLAVCLIFTVSACSVSNEGGGKFTAKVAENLDKKLVKANNEFAFHLYNQLTKTGQQGKNVFISPTSISLALSMTYNGADGRTKAAMADALKFKDISLETLNEENLKLRSVLQHADEDVTLEIANSIWARKGIEFKSDFMDRNKDYYNSYIKALDFADPKTTKIINGWVSKATHGKIDSIVDEKIDPQTVMFLINAIYFNGEWTEPFKAENTKKVPFTNQDGLETHVDMMFQNGEYKYFKGDKFQALALPYGKERISMYIFLPDKDSTLDDLYNSMTVENWDNWMANFSTREGDIGLPKIELEYEKNLNDILKAMGMEIAFDEEQADLGLMYDRSKSGENIYIGNVRHKTFLRLDEKGTEAAGVTSVEIKEGCAEKEEDKFTMIMDRPFFFTIQDENTGTILFMGSINKA